MTKEAFILDELKKVTRRLENLEKTVDTLGSDRNILEDILLRIAELENALRMNRDKQDEVSKNLQKGIKSVEYSVQDELEKLQKDASGKMVIMLKPKSWDKIKKILKIK